MFDAVQKKFAGLLINIDPDSGHKVTPEGSATTTTIHMTIKSFGDVDSIFSLDVFYINSPHVEPVMVFF